MKRDKAISSLKQLFVYYNQNVEYLNRSKAISIKRIEDFNMWYKNTAKPIFEKIESTLSRDADEERICSLIEFYNLLIEKNVREQDFEGLIGNLYFIPEKIKSSFEKFHLVDTNLAIEEKIKLSTYLDELKWGFKFEYIAGDLDMGSPVLII